MTLSKLLVAGLATALLTLHPVVASAQETPAEETATEAPAAEAPAEGEAPAAESDAATPSTESSASRDPAENWLKICEPAAEGQRACMMRQVVYTNNQFRGSFLLRNDPGQESRLFAVAAVPLGVMLPFSLQWQIDNGTPIRVPYMMCDPQACITQLVINEAYVNSLKKGAKLKLTAKTRSSDPAEPVRDYVVEINLGGFTAVYDREEALTWEQFNEQTSGASALEKELEDRAEELRRQLSGETGTETPATEEAPATGN